jgi:signal transduction histidine kinase/DNA-binding response OmpR family regulator/ligand-binding sensor domain-containing protein
LFIFTQFGKRNIKDLEKRWRRLTSFIFCAFIAGSILAQEASSISKQGNQVLKSQFWGIDEGLSHRQVNSIVQDDQSLIWLATNFGLNRFDGKNFKWFTIENSPIQKNAITGLKKDEQGFIWLLYTDLNEYKIRAIDIVDPISEEIKKVDDFFSDSLPFKLSAIKSINLVETEELIFVTDSSLFIYTDQFHEIDLKHVDLKNLRCVERDPEGNFWLSYYLHYPYPTILKVLDPNGKPIDSLSLEGSFYLDIYEWDTLGQAHFYTYDHAQQDSLARQEYYIFKPGNTLQRDSAAQQRFVHLNFKNNFVRRFFRKIDNNYWVYSQDQRVMMVPQDLDKESIELRSVSKELKKPTCIFKDDDGVVWLGTSFGIYRYTFDDQRFRRHFFNNNLSEAASIRGLKITREAKAKKLWAMSEVPGSLYEEDLQTNEIKISQASSGGKWALGLDRNGSLNYMTDHSFNIRNQSRPSLNRSFPLPFEYTSSTWVIHQDKYDQYWFNNLFTADLYSLKGDSLNQIKQWHQAEENVFLYQIYENSSDTAWLATSKGIFSLHLQKKEIMERYWSKGRGKYLLPYDNIQHILPEKENTFWLSTAKEGLVKWSPKEGVIKKYGRLEGLPSNNVYACYKDQKGNLWLSTEYGIAHINHGANKIRSYTEKDGLTSNEFNRISYLQDEENGRIYFGGLNGVTSFQPRDFYEGDDEKEANLVIMNLQVYKQKEDSIFNYSGRVRRGETLDILPGDFITELSISLLSYEQQEKVLYAYRLNDLDKDWTYQASGVIQLGKLPFGDFTLALKGQEASGHWSSKQLSINISVIKPFYLRDWFIASCGLFAMLALVLYFDIRDRGYLRRQKELQKLVVERTQTIESQKEDLLSLDRMKSHFFANISHELRTPLSLISTPLIKLISEGKSFTIKEKQLLNYMQHNAVVLANLVDEILDLVKLESGKLELNFKQVELFQHLQKQLEPFRSLAKAQSLVFDWQINIDPNIWVEIDPTKMDKVLSNLLSNAFKYTPKGGTISVQVRPDQNDNLFISVTDNGIGIKLTEQEKVFDRFFQASPNENEGVVEAKGGTGIGLSLSYDLIKLMGGRLWLESEWGKGSTFYCTFPYRIVSRQATIAAEDKPLVSPQVSGTGDAQTNEDLNKPHILIVEDNAQLLSFLQDLLQDKYRISLAENGAVAWAILNRKKDKTAFKKGEAIDLVISDQMMPVMSGLSLLKRIKEEESLALLPFIMLTAHPEGQVKMNALRIGVNDFLTKPFEAAELRLRIKNLLHNRENRKQVLIELEEKDLAISTEVNSLKKEDQVWLERFDIYIQQNLSKSDLKVTDMSFEFAMSDSTLLRQVKKITGLSPQKYLQEARLLFAISQLDQGDFSSVSKLAKSVGFSELASFSRSFKARFGKSPSAFAK